MKVIGAGFARTGTLSMQSALDTLGFGRTYHMNDVFQNPSHAQLWLDFAESRTAALRRFRGCCRSDLQTTPERDDQQAVMTRI